MKDERKRKVLKSVIKECVMDLESTINRAKQLLERLDNKA